jgi:hypothetical protein
MTYITGWERAVRLARRGIGGARHPHPGPQVGDGPQHAVPEGADTALCGVTVPVTGGPWGSHSFGSRCFECTRQAATTTGD